MARAVTASLTQTRLDFANSILIGTSGINIGTSGSNLNKLQHWLDGVVLQDNYSSATSLLSGLYWLPVNKRSNFKIATLTYQSLAFGQPTYLSSVLTPHQPQRSLRSVNQNLLSVPRCNSSFGQRSFPTVLLKSGITYHFRSEYSSLDSFKHNLKTHYFASNRPPGDCLQRLGFDTVDTMRSKNC